jgi:hypothetical protein
MKRAIVLAFFAGVGAATILAGSVVFVSWRANRPKPWNPTAITATFDSIDTEGPEKKLVFYYVLQNNTDGDFRIASDAAVVLVGNLAKQQSLTTESSKELLSGEFPLFVPAKQRARLGIHLGYAYSGAGPLSDGATKPDRDHDRALLTGYVRDELSNLAGFVIFHEATRYQIELPGGWK